MSYKSYVAAEVAAYILFLEKNSMEVKRLATMMYLVERESLIKTGSPLTNDSMIAAANGPSLMLSYNILMHQRLEFIFPWKKYLKRNKNEFIELNNKHITESSFENLSIADRRIIQSISWTYKDSSMKEFLEQVVKDCPEWKHVLTIANAQDSREITYMNILLLADMPYDAIQHVVEEIAAQHQIDKVLEPV